MDKEGTREARCQEPKKRIRIERSVPRLTPGNADTEKVRGGELLAPSIMLITIIPFEFLHHGNETHQRCHFARGL